MCADLLEIYYWYIHPPDLSFLWLSDGGGAPLPVRNQVEIELSLVRPPEASTMVSATAGMMADAAAVEMAGATEGEMTGEKVAGAALMGTTSYKLSEWGQGSHSELRGQNEPFEMAVTRITCLSKLQKSLVAPLPLRKVFYLAYRVYSHGSWEIRWLGEWMLSYCPSRNGRTTRPADPKATTEQGSGAGRVYWHGRLVPDTRIERVAWLSNIHVIMAVIMAQHATSNMEDHVLQEVRQTAARHNNVVSSMFMNCRLSDDKLQAASFKQQDLDYQLQDALLQPSEGVSDMRLRALAPLRKAFRTGPSDPGFLAKQLLISETKFVVTSGSEPGCVEATGLEGVQKVFQWIKRVSDLYDDLPPPPPPPSMRREEDRYPDNDVSKTFTVDFKETVGHGGKGPVFAATSRATGESLAVKVLDTRRVTRQAIRKECQILDSLTHANIIGVRGHGVRFDAPPPPEYATRIPPDVPLGKDGYFYYIFMELAAGGELFDQVWLGDRHVISEPVALGFFRQMLDGVNYCHLAGVAHRGLKLEEFLLSEGVIKLIDFGLSHVYPRLADGSIDRSHPLRGVCGSHSYAAPEVLADDGYDGFAADMWSLGVCLFAMLSGFFPLDTASPADWRYGKLVEAQAMGKSSVATIYGFYQKPIADLSASASATSLMDGLLQIDPATRLTMAQSRKHPWVTDKSVDGEARAANPSTTSNRDIIVGRK